jgi:hypothetical protein
MVHLKSSIGLQPFAHEKEKLDAFTLLSAVLSNAVAETPPAAESKPAQSAYNICSALAPLLPKGEDTAVKGLLCWKTVRDMYNDMKQDCAGSDKGLSYAQPDSNLDSFKKFRNTLTVAEGHLKKLEAGDEVLRNIMPMDRLSKLILGAHEIASGGISHFQNSALAKLVESNKALKLIAGGMEDGSNWDADLAPKASWGDYLEKVKENIIGKDDLVDRITAARDVVLKDRA